MNRAAAPDGVKGSKPSVVTSTEGFALGDPKAKTEPIDTSKVIWGKAEQVIKAGVDARKGNSMVLTVEKVLDGDTVKAGGLVCRLDGIDAQETAKPFLTPPQPGQAYGEAAKAELQRMIENKEVNITVTKSKDAYDRSVCQIDIQGKNVTAELVKAGAAMLTEKFWKDGPEGVQEVGQREALRVLQKGAQSSSKGIHGLPIQEQEGALPYRNRMKKIEAAYKAAQN